MRAYHFIIALSLVLVAHALALYGFSFIGGNPPPAPPQIIQASLITIPPPKVEEPPPPVKPKKLPEPVKENKPVVQKPVPVVTPEKIISVENNVTASTNALAAEPTPPAPEPVEQPVIPPRVDAKHSDNPPPDYPRLARRMSQQGTVVLEVLILANGTVGEIRLKNSSGFPRLDESAIEAVKHWHYVPAKRGDQAIDYWYTQPVKFVLN